MRATYIYGAGDIRVINVPDPAIQQPTDAIVRVVRACICGSDLHPYHSMPVTPGGQSIGHECVGIVEDTGADVTCPPTNRRSRSVKCPVMSPGTKRLPM